ncbi:hypothetical protein D3C84_1250210 [compost metagenome]
MVDDLGLWIPWLRKILYFELDPMPLFHGKGVSVDHVFRLSDLIVRDVVQERLKCVNV